MIELVNRLLGRTEATLSDAATADTQAIAVLHAASFRRGWSDDEVEGLMAESNVIADRATIGLKLVGFILTRLAADEAEILSIAVSRNAQGRGLGGRLLRRNLQRLVAFGVRSVFLEVDANNVPALALYRRIGFVEVGQRAHYYGTDDKTSNALVLRRDLV